jgi:hypothetical protein
MGKEEFDLNEYFDDAVAQMRDDPCLVNFSHVVAALALMANKECEVPTPLQDEVHVVWNFDPNIELEDAFPEDMEVGNRIVVMSDGDGCKWLPVYTNREELIDLAETNAITNIPVRAILEQVLEDEMFEGVIINPDTTCLAVYRETVEFILDHADGEFLDAC